MQNELIAENIGNSGEPSPGGLNSRVEDTIVQLVFGGVLWNKVKKLTLIRPFERGGHVFCPLLTTTITIDRMLIVRGLHYQTRPVLGFKPRNS